MDKDLYYNPNRMLSYNRILNFVIGARGIGKSYSFKIYPIKRFIKYGEQFIYLRRYKTDLKKFNNYFDDVRKEFPDHELKIKGKQMFIDGKLFGWAVPLSSWQSEKSTAYPNVSTIVYDEALREKDNSRYLTNEPEALLNFMDTVFRDRENVRTICLSNAVTIINPYFIYFNIIPDVKRRYNANESVVVEIPDSIDFTEERLKTKFGKLIKGTDYADMSLNNEFTEDSDLFIYKREKRSTFQFNIVYNGITMGVWTDNDHLIMYTSYDHDPSSKLTFALNTRDFKENTLLTNYKSNYFLLKWVSAFKRGLLRFDDQMIRTTAYEIFRKMNIQ